MSIWQRISHNLVLHRPSGVYYARKSRKGKGAFFKTTGHKKRGIAQTKADDMIAEWLGTKKRLQNRTLSDICDELEIILEQEFRDGHRRRDTCSHDRTYLPQVKKYFGGLTAEELDEEYWDQWCRGDGKKLNRPLFDIAKYVSKALTFAYSRKYLSRKPRIRNPDKPKKSGLVYEDETILQFYQHAEPLLKDLILLAAENPLRPHEVREARWEWLKLTKDGFIYRLPESFTKTKSARELLLSPNASEMLKVRKKNADKACPWVFPGPREPDKPVSKKHLSRMWRSMLLLYGMTPGKYRFHWLRHTFYSKALLDAKIPIQLVSEAGGTSITTLQKKYLHSNATRTASVSKAVNLGLGEKHEHE